MSNIVLLHQTENSIRVQIQNQRAATTKFILSFALIVSFSIPVTVVIAAAINGILNFALIIGISVFSFLVIYPLLKTTIWECSGQEIFTIYKDRVTYEACFKLLKNQFDKIQTNQLEILFSERELEKDERIGTLVFLSEENKLKSALKIKETDYLRLLEYYKLL